MALLYEKPGIALPLRSHRPTEPFGKRDYRHPETSEVEAITPEDVGNLSYDEITFARHPRERHKPSILPLPEWFADNQTAKLSIECMLSVGSYGAKVVLCSVDNAPKAAWEKMGQDCPELIVAKIFDPLNYNDTPDPVAAADREYAQEAAAYFRMHSERLAKNPAYMDKPDLVPGFYGTWTTDITRDHLRKSFMSPHHKKKTKKKEALARKKFEEESKAATSAKDVVHSFRPVRIILLEYIEGSTVSNLCAKEPVWSRQADLRPHEPYQSQEKRLAIFHSIMDTGYRIGHFGITHFKRYPTSFIVKESDDRVVITDFSQSETWTYVDVGFHIQERLPRPLHPMTVCDIDKWWAFRGWFPPEWLEDVSLYDTWGEATFAHDQYTDKPTAQKISKELDWVNTPRTSGRVPSCPGDPTYKGDPRFKLPGNDKELEERWRIQAIAMGNIPPNFKTEDRIPAFQ
ncbi:hypothetical protein F5X68DRAFT_276952 [Plectosphaerella plurivora]|uniref:Protein kinase domain-containing protein n=1 Tax=Plectosphaerella plurivora TaxID=936078 RepID=A0A9P9AAX3_9PEZI|nr:hypothetical protein F5X68DRAFT_276952 [Plectosphaerella plurivora]